MDFLVIASAALGVVMLCVGVIGGLHPMSLKDKKMGEAPNRWEIFLGGLVLGSLLLLLSLYLNPSELLRTVLIFSIPVALICSAVYGVVGVVRGVKPSASQESVSQGSPFQLEQGVANKKHHDRSDGINYSHPLGKAITPMLRTGDWDGARQYLQKIAYGMPTATEKEKSNFTEFMVSFAEHDPLYQRCLVDIQNVLKEHPGGIRQTSLYPHMTSALAVEQARYVLYYAEALGDIVRVKKGNSYTVFPAGTVVAPAAPKKKKQRAISSAPESEITERSK